MNLTDLEQEPPTIDPTPRPHMGRRPVEDDYPTRPNASQVVAASKRQQPSAAPDPRQLLLGVAALAFVVAMVVAGIWQMTRSAPAPLALPTPAPAPPQATIAPEPTQAAPVPTVAPAPPVAPGPSGDVTGALQEAPPMTGRGMGVDTSIEDGNRASAEAALEDAILVGQQQQYLNNVGAQAPHSPRGDGKLGPNGGDWVAVPTLTSQQLEVIGAQAPHKVR